MDGRPPAEPAALRIVDPLQIEIEKVGRIQVRPVVADAAFAEQSQRGGSDGSPALELGVARAPNARARQLEFELAADMPLAGNAAALRQSWRDPCWPEAAAVDGARRGAERQIDSPWNQLRRPGELDGAVRRATRKAQRMLPGCAARAGNGGSSSCAPSWPKPSARR